MCVQLLLWCGSRNQKLDLQAFSQIWVYLSILLPCTPWRSLVNVTSRSSLCRQGIPRAQLYSRCGCAVAAEDWSASHILSFYHAIQDGVSSTQRPPHLPKQATPLPAPLVLPRRLQPNLAFQVASSLRSRTPGQRICLIALRTTQNHLARIPLPLLALPVPPDVLSALLPLPEPDRRLSLLPPLYLALSEPRFPQPVRTLRLPEFAVSEGFEGEVPVVTVFVLISFVVVVGG